MSAFALGWQMAELYRPDARSQRQPADHDDLPGLGRLDESQHEQIALKQVEAAVTKLGDAVKAAGLPPLSVSAFASCLSPGTTSDDRKQALGQLHVELLSTLTAADFGLGKAYGLGRALTDTCRNPVDAEMLAKEFDTDRIAKLRSWLDDLASALPAHAGRSVAASLDRWARAVSAPKEEADPSRTRTSQKDQASLTEEQAKSLLALLPRQGQLWRTLLSAEKAGMDLLEIGEYVDTATGCCARRAACCADSSWARRCLSC